MAVGLVEGELFDLIQEAEIQLEPGDLTLLYTDGLFEAVNGASEEYGRERLIERLAKGHAERAQPLLDDLVGEVEAFAGGVPQHDDITLVALRVREEGEGAAREEPVEVRESA